MIFANLDTNAATTLYVMVRDPRTGALGFLPATPAVLPDSALRFHRGRPALPPRRGRP